MDVEERLTALEQRLRVAEDHLAILNLLNSYGPLVDSGSAEPAAELWIEGGGYNFSGGTSQGTRLEAPDRLVAMYRADGHMGLVKTGVSHLTATPVVKVNGDEATALGYTFVVLREDERWYIFRGAINEWKLVRTTDGWRIAERFNRTLTGSDESHEVMRRILNQ